MKRKRLNHDVDVDTVQVTPKRARADAHPNNKDLSSKSARHSVNRGKTDQETNTPSRKAGSTTKAEYTTHHDSSKRRGTHANALAVRQRADGSDEEDPVTKSSTPQRATPRNIHAGEHEQEGQSAPDSHGQEELATAEEDPSTPVTKPRGRPRGRPRKNKSQRSPSPVDLPPHEHYFFQNRAGAGKTSDHTLASMSFLNHEEYFKAIARFEDHHAEELDFLQELHTKSFQQWSFELQEGFNVCLYGWGSKRKLLTAFAEYVQDTAEATDKKIVVVNGYAQDIHIRDILTAVAAAIPGLSNQKLGAQPHDMLERISKGISASTAPLLLIIHSIDAQPLRRGVAQSILAALGHLTGLHLIVSVDNPNYPLLWDSALASQFNFAHHDTTTFATFDVELGGSDGGVVDSINSLFGRYGRAISGKEGVVFVLKSLTDNARRLYALLVAEILSIADDAGDEAGGIGAVANRAIEEGDANDDLEEVEDGAQRSRPKKAGKATGLEYNMFYRKAMSQLIATNEIAFRTLLKEFYDHQMLVSRKDTLGTEFLSVPFRREECQAILEDLVID